MVYVKLTIFFVKEIIKRGAGSLRLNEWQRSMKRLLKTKNPRRAEVFKKILRELFLNGNLGLHFFLLHGGMRIVAI